MARFLDALPYLLVMLAVVPVLSFCCSGSWRTAWRYTRIWSVCVAALAAAGGVLVLIAA